MKEPKFVYTTLRLEHFFRDLRENTQGVPTLAHALIYKSRSFQNLVLKDKNMDYLMKIKNVKISITNEERKKLLDYARSIGKCTFQHTVRCAKMYPSTPPANYRLSQPDPIWIPLNTVIFVHAGVKTFWVARTTSDTTTTSAGVEIRYYEKSGYDLYCITEKDHVISALSVHDFYAEIEPDDEIEVTEKIRTAFESETLPKTMKKFKIEVVGDDENPFADVEV